MFLHSKFSDFARAARRLLRSLPGFWEAAGAIPAGYHYAMEKLNAAGTGAGGLSANAI